jgi:hypothetical protein
VRASTRRALAAVAAALGIVLMLVGAWMVVVLGPSGEAQFSATAKAPGSIAVTPDVLNAVDVPVRVTATRRDGGALFLGVAPSADARSILAGSAVSTVNGVHYPQGRLDLAASGTGARSDLSAADIWRLSAKGPRSAALVVDQGMGPETLVVASGDTTALTDATVTLTWNNRAWFFEALAMATIGAVLATFAVNDLWQGRALALQRHFARTRTRIKTRTHPEPETKTETAEATI